jgi:hypothetical protein
MADPPGAGKTYVALGLTLLDREARRAGFDIFVVPQNILAQWQEAVRRLSPELVCVNFTRYSDVAGGNVRDRLRGADLALATPLCFNALADAMEAEGLRARRLVMDEADNGCDALVRRLAPCGVRWIVSASVMNATEASTSALASALGKPTRSRLQAMADRRMSHDPSRPARAEEDDAVPPERVVLCDPAFVAASVPLPAPELLQVRCGSREIGLMRDLLTAEETRAAMAMDFSALNLRHVGRVAANETEALALLVADRVLSADAETARLEDLAREASALERKEERSADEEMHLEMLMQRAEQAVAERGKHQRAVELVRSRLREREACLVCFEDFADSGLDRVITPCCANTFCAPCVAELLERASHMVQKPKCPTCRASMDVDAESVTVGGAPLVVVSDDGGTSGTLGTDIINQAAQVPRVKPKRGGELGKLDALRLLMSEGGGTGTDVIVFSDYGQVFRRARALLEEMGVECIELDGGSAPEIEAVLRRYKRSQQEPQGPRHRRVLLASSYLHGAGVNMENTTDIVFMHRLKKELWEQVVGRAQRPGRVGALRVHQLLFDQER